MKLRKVILVMALLGVLTALSGCQAVAGLGRDITWTAEKTEELLESR